MAAAGYIARRQSTLNQSRNFLRNGPRCYIYVYVCVFEALRQKTFVL